MRRRKQSLRDNESKKNENEEHVYSEEILANQKMTDLIMVQYADICKTQSTKPHGEHNDCKSDYFVPSSPDHRRLYQCLFARMLYGSSEVPRSDRGPCASYMVILMTLSC